MMMNIKTNNYSLDLKLRIVKVYNEKILTVPNICKLFCVSKSSVYNWIKLFNDNQLYNKKIYIKPTSFFQNKEIRNFILTYIQLNPNFDYFKLIALIFDSLKIQISKSTLFCIIHDLNLTKKVVKFKKVYGSPEKLEIKKESLKKQIKNINNNKIISIDEISFDTNIINNYAWSPKGITVIKSIGATYKRLTMICAITNKKILHYKILNNSAKSDTFLQFIKDIPNIKDKYLFLDNACIHHSKIVSKYVKDNNINLLFNVPYSPEFNPIEIMFSKLKSLVKKTNNNQNLKSLTTNIINSMKYITSNNLNNFFIHSFNKLRDISNTLKQ
jgi:transposase